MSGNIAIGIQDFSTIIQGMVGLRGQCDFDHPSASFWKDTYNEYGGAVLFHRLCRQVRFV